MADIALRTKVTDRKNSVLISLSITLGIVCLVFLFIGLLGGKRAPEGLTAAIPFLAGIGLIAIGFGIWRSFVTKAELFITSGNGAYGITILSAQKKKLVEFFSPVKMICGWELNNLGKGKKFYHLRILFLNPNGKCLLTLETNHHSLHGYPEGWKELSPELIAQAENKYSCAELSVVARVVKKLER